jgi:hypothetical protein
MIEKFHLIMSEIKKGYGQNKKSLQFSISKCTC